MKTSYVHFQTPHGRSLGFSTRIDFHGAKNQRGDLLCQVATTFCNSKDKHFNKKIARAVLSEKEGVEVRVRDLPRMLGAAADKARGNVFFTPSFDYVLRRFV